MNNEEKILTMFEALTTTVGQMDSSLDRLETWNVQKIQGNK